LRTQIIDWFLAASRDTEVIEVGNALRHRIPLSDRRVRFICFWEAMLKTECEEHEYMIVTKQTSLLRDKLVSDNNYFSYMEQFIRIQEQQLSSST
jgi:hypothetical protein